MKTAAIIPCYNEELTIAQVIKDIRRCAADCDIYVFDNNSTDNSYNIAKDKGVNVFKVSYQGKGEVVRYAFSKVDADIYVLIDADNECDASAIPRLVVKLKEEELDMITVIRDKGTYRAGHSFGNKMLTTMIKILFSKNCNDVNSGYRIFSKKFVKTFPSHSSGFEIETELSVFALEMRLPIGEMKAEYKSRPEGSFSKLNTFRDGFRILGLIIYLTMSERPLMFWWAISLFFAFFGFYFGIPIVINFLKTGITPVATSVLTIGFVMLSAISIITGLIMNATQRAISEVRRYQYLNVK